MKKGCLSNLWHLCLIISVAVQLFACNTIKAQSIFSYAIYDKYKAAYDLNEAGRYLEAYRAILEVKNQMTTEMGDMSPKNLSENDFLSYWWPVNRSVAEIAYRLGLTDVMLSVADEMDSALASYDIDKDNYYAQLIKLDAGRHFLSGELSVAEIELRKALQLASPYEESFISDLHDELAQLYYRQQLYQQALEQLDSVLPDAELAGQQALCLAQMGHYDKALSILDRQKPQTQRKKAELLRQKAKIHTLRYDATGDYNPLAYKYYNDYLLLSRAYIDAHFINMTEAEREQYWMAEYPFVTDCYRLENKAPELLYDVALYSKAVLLQMGRKFKPGMSDKERKKVLSDIKVTWKQVQRRLPDTAAAIEFILYERGHSDHLGAVILHKKGKPQFVHIAPMSEILNHILPDGKTLEEAMSLTDDANVINSIYEDSAFHKLIWNDAIMEALGNTPTLFFAPDGLLHRIAMEYMLPGRKLFRLSSTRMLAESPRKIRTDSMLMVGGIDYKSARREESSRQTDVDNDDLAYQLIAPLNMHLPPLNGTKYEVDAVLKTRPDKTNKILLADSATEMALRNLIGKYHIVLLSTHGWVDDVALVGTALRPATTDAQLSHSCLFLSGAENNMLDSSFNMGEPDGILSAREIASMDLSEVDLAVLSACVSGLGFVTPEGIYGLQRGLKTAGVRAVIVSLWNVNDYATSILIQNLYANIEHGLPLHEAFYQAREQLRASSKSFRVHGRNKKRSLDRPFFTDAFILIDGIE